MGIKNIWSKIKSDRAKGGAKEKAEKEPEAEEPEGKYDEACALCGGTGTEKKWMGQYWHRKCLRGIKKGARKMI